MRMMIKRLRGVGKRDCWSQELGRTAGEVESMVFQGCMGVGNAWEGGEVLRGDVEDFEDCRNNSLILFCALYSSASLLSSLSVSNWLVSRSVSSRPSRVASTLVSRLEFSASFFSCAFSNIVLTSSASASAFSPSVRSDSFSASRLLINLLLV